MHIVNARQNKEEPWAFSLTGSQLSQPQDNRPLVLFHNLNKSMAYKIKV